MSGRFDWFIQRLDNGLVDLVDRRYIGEVLGERFSRNGQAVTVEQPLVKQVFHHCRYPAILVQILHQIFSAWFKISQYRRRIAHPLEIILCDFDAHTFADGDEMQYSIGASAKDDNEAYGVFKRLPGHDV